MLRVQPFSRYNKTSAINKSPNHKTYSETNNLSTKPISFGSLRRTITKPIDTDFFRGINTLKTAVNYILRKYPRGTNILDYACSSGEETLSLAMLLGDRYRIIGLDSDSDAIKLAKNGIHSVFSDCEDSFLLGHESKLTREQAYLKQLFHKYFSPTEEPECSLNNSSGYLSRVISARFKEEHFKMESAATRHVEFRDPAVGDVLNVDSFEPTKRVGGIFFRNAFYHLTGNNISEILKGGTIIKPDTEKIAKIVDRVHSRLDDDGIFVIGSHTKEHLFIASENTADSETIKYSDTETYKANKEKLQILWGTSSGNKAIENLSRLKDLRFLKTSPLRSALEKDGKFIPVYWDRVEEFPELKVPVIWQKVTPETN